MSLFLPLKRATLLIPSGPESDKDRKHLFILLNDPHDDESGKACVLMVSLSTVRQGVYPMTPLVFCTRAIMLL